VVAISFQSFLTTRGAGSRRWVRWLGGLPSEARSDHAFDDKKGISSARDWGTYSSTGNNITPTARSISQSVAMRATAAEPVSVKMRRSACV
jgi:hypothetical protein